MAILLVFVAIIATPAVMAQEKTAESITVFAAASMTEVITELAQQFETANHIKPKLSFASSAVLARQIEAGAPADVFVSADPAWTEYLDKKHLLEPGSVVTFAQNTLVIIAPAEKTFTFVPKQGADLASAFQGRLAVGDPESVPAGKYAKESLTWMKSWDALKSRLAPAADVRAALRLVASGETAAGIVYKTDALAEPKVKMVAEFPAASHAAIVYTAGLCKNTKEPAKKFLALVKDTPGKEALLKHGFTLPEKK